MYQWGSGNYGELGVNHTDCLLKPYKIECPNILNAKSSISYGTATIVISGYNSIFIINEISYVIGGGSMYIFGRLGETMARPTSPLRRDLLSIDKNKPRQCEELRNLIISDVVLGDRYCIAISSNNTLNNINDIILI